MEATTQQPAGSSGAKELESFSDLFSRSWSIFKEFAGQLIAFFFAMIGIEMGVMFVFWIIFAVLFAVGGVGLAGLTSDTGELSGGVMGAIIAVGVLFYILFIVLIMVLVGWLQASEMYLVIETAAKRRCSVSDALRRGWKKKWSLVGLTLLMMVIVYFGFFLFIVPGVILMVRYIFAPFIMMSENLTVTDSLRRSWAITKGHFWAILGRGLLLWLVFVVPMFIPIVNIAAMFFMVMLAPFFVYFMYRSLLSQKQ